MASTYGPSVTVAAPARTRTTALCAGQVSTTYSRTSAPMMPATSASTPAASMMNFTLGLMCEEGTSAGSSISIPCGFADSVAYRMFSSP